MHVLYVLLENLETGSLLYTRILSPPLWLHPEWADLKPDKFKPINYPSLVNEVVLGEFKTRRNRFSMHQGENNGMKISQ